jgi:phosphonate transport system substrate-binding protein
LQGNRYDGKPVYFSDIIVHRDSPFRSFADLQGRSWAYNEPNSHSGYGITRYQLARLGRTIDYFSAFIESGFHERSIRMVCSGEVDASAIDSQVLQISLRDHPELAARLRVIESWGPSTIQPFVAGRHLPTSLRADLQSVLLEIAENAEAKKHLARGFVHRFVAVDDSSYNDLRQMLAVAE